MNKVKVFASISKQKSWSNSWRTQRGQWPKSLSTISSTLSSTLATHRSLVQFLQLKSHLKLKLPMKHFRRCLLPLNILQLKVCVLSFTASQRQLGQDSLWVQDTENSKTSYCGHCPRGHWWPRSRVWRRYRASVLPVKRSAGVSGRTVRLLDWQLSRSATLYIRVLRTLLALWQDIYCAFRPSSRQQRKLARMFGDHLCKLIE